jgi:hypothetical protein
MVLMLVRVTRRMTGSTVLGCLAGLLLAVDGLHFVQSRVAMLDIFLAMWVLAAFCCLVADRDSVRRRLAVTDDDDLRGFGPGLGWRPWRLLAGICLGAAVGTKWSGLYYVVVLVLLALRLGGRRAPYRRHPGAGALRPSCVGLPAAAHAAGAAGRGLPAVVVRLVRQQRPPTSWRGTATGPDSNPASGVVGLGAGRAALVVALPRGAVRVPRRAAAEAPVPVAPARLAAARPPVSYYYPGGVGPGDYGCEVESCSREVLAIGTPALWWAVIPMLLLLLWLWLAKRDWRPAAALALVLTGIVPWIRDDLDGRTMFLFYALPAVPFMCLGFALVAGWLLGGPGVSARRRTAAAMGVGVWVAVVILNFAYLYPVLAAQTLPYAEWQDRMWFTSWI